MSNPYRPPATTANAGPALFSSQHVALASYIGMPLGGSIVMAINYTRLKQPAAAVGTLIGGLCATVLILFIAFTMPFELPTGTGLGFGLIYAFAMMQIASVLQKDDIEHAIAEGGKTASVFTAAGIGFASLAVAAGSCVGVYCLIAV